MLNALRNVPGLRTFVSRGTFSVYPDVLRFSFSCGTAMVREGSIRLRESLV